MFSLLIIIDRIELVIYIKKEGEIIMMYPYVKYPDGTEVTFSNIYIDNNQECIDIQFERPTENGFDSVRIKLPTYEVTIWEGKYTNKEIDFFKQVAKNSSDLFYKYAKEGGFKIE